MSSSPITFITGATGFIGSHVVKNALAAGTRVRLSVRKEEQIETLKQLFSAKPDQLEFVVIPDISNPEAFEGKLDGVEHVLHLASPMPGTGEDFKSDYLKPAVEGTESILKAAKASSSVKRVVVTSSVLAVIPLGQMNASDLHIKGELMLLEGLIKNHSRLVFLADSISPNRGPRSRPQGRPQHGLARRLRRPRREVPCIQDPRPPSHGSLDEREQPQLLTRHHTPYIRARPQSHPEIRRRHQRYQRSLLGYAASRQAAVPAYRRRRSRCCGCSSQSCDGFFERTDY